MAENGEDEEVKSEPTVEQNAEQPPQADLHYLEPVREFDDPQTLYEKDENSQLPGAIGDLKSTLRVLFIHGGGWGKGRHLGQQKFAVYLREHFKQNHIEEMQNTSLFDVCIAQQSRAIVEFRPHLIVCKSQGGPTLLRLIQSGVWKGPSLMCCPAIVGGVDDFTAAAGVPFVILSGADDVAVPVRNVVALEMHNRKQDIDMRRVIVRDGHALFTTLQDRCPETHTGLACTQLESKDRHIDYCLRHLVHFTWHLYLAKPIDERTPVSDFCADQVPLDHQQTWIKHQQRSDDSESEVGSSSHSSSSCCSECIML